MKKIIAVILACVTVALLTVCFVFGEDMKMNTYEHGRTLLSEEDMQNRAEPDVFDLLYEYACTEKGADIKYSDRDLEYFDIESDGKGAAVRFDCGGMHQAYYNMFFTEDSGKTWELHESFLHLTAGYQDFVFADGKLTVFNYDCVNLLSGVTVYDSETREFTEYCGEELINRAGFSDCGVTELRLCADVLYKNSDDNTFAVGWAYSENTGISSFAQKSKYILIAEYSPDFELKNVLSLDSGLVRLYKTVEKLEPFMLEELLVTDRKLDEDDIYNVMRLDGLNLDTDKIVEAAKKVYEDKEDKTETDVYNLEFLGGWYSDGYTHYFRAPD